VPGNQCSSSWYVTIPQLVREKSLVTRRSENVRNSCDTSTGLFNYGICEFESYNELSPNLGDGRGQAAAA